MDFFKSVFSDNPISSNHEKPQKSHPQTPTLPDEEGPGRQEPTLHEINPISNPSPNPKSSESSAWSFGGLLKTVALRSETVIQTYRRDLEEFGSGLKKETAAFREAATQAVKDLPVSIDAAQGSLESVWRGTAEILASNNSEDSNSNLSSDVESDSVDNNAGRSKRFSSRFEMQVRAVQSDLDTYCLEPEDLGEFGKWKLGFVMEEKGEEIEDLIGENEGVMREVYRKFVPSVVDDESFWSRYFYRIYKLKEAEEARVKLVKRAVSGDDEEEDWSWDVADDDDNKKGEITELDEKKPLELAAMEKQGNVVDKDEVDGVSASVVESNSDNGSGEKASVDNETQEFAAEKQWKIFDGEVGDNSDKAYVAEIRNDNRSVENMSLDKDGDVSELNDGAKLSKEGLERKTGESCKVNELSVREEEEDIGWDEIEDLGSDNEKKTGGGASSSNRADLRRRLSVADEEEDLSWDIEDDDVPVKH